MTSKEFHGLVLVDKPSGITSHDVVAKLRRILGTKSIGHSGTLDPLASGLMVCLVNEGTKLSQYILEGDKAYRVRAQFGLRTDTLDTTGQTLETFPMELGLERLQQAMRELEGEFEFPVPIFSAIKIQGKKLYDYAREEKAVEIPFKKMRFYDIRLLAVEEGWADFEIKCSKGSYIRTWVDELGKKLGGGAAMSALRRIWSSPYAIDQALTFEKLEQQMERQRQQELASPLAAFGAEGFVSLEQALPQVKKIRIKGQDRVLLKNGQISHDLRVQLIASYKMEEVPFFVQVMSQETGQLLALVGLEPQKGFVLRRVFPLGF